MRQDILSLTPDDLILLANRGLAKRAQQEIQSGEYTYELDEDDQGRVTLRWSDGVSCVLPGGTAISAARCSCPATTICRHILRSVLAYQQHQAEDQPSPIPTAWDPGSILDNVLTRHVSRAAMVWARRVFDEGQVVELVRAVKPSAYLHSLACTVRFMVPNDIGYTHCDCAEPAPCRHVPLAVWAFRKLADTQASGIVETASVSAAPPIMVLDELDQVLRELVALGMSGAPQALIERMRRLEQRSRESMCIWPADALADLTQQHAAYTSHDARFSPGLVAALVGELCIRADAMRANTGVVPQLFVRGSAADRETAVGTARLIGLGCDVRVRRGGVQLAAYMQDADSGSLVVVRRDVDDPTDDTVEPAQYWQLAQTPIVKGAGIASLGEGQVLVKGGRRFPNGAFVPGRAQLSLNPQAFAWESLRAPVLVEDFAELAARLAAQPPSALRPRRLTDGLYVCAVTGTGVVAFEAVEQTVRAVVQDANGGQATLVHPYTARGQHGVDVMLSQLTTQANNLRFVAGHVRLTPHGPVINPTALVFQTGSTRRAVMPSVAQKGDDASGVATGIMSVSGRSDPLVDYWAQVNEALGDLLVVGLSHSDEHMLRRWQELAALGIAYGFGRSVQPLERLAAELAQKVQTLRWNSVVAAAVVLEIACLGLLAGDAISAQSL